MADRPGPPPLCFWRGLDGLSLSSSDRHFRAEKSAVLVDFFAGALAPLVEARGLPHLEFAAEAHESDVGRKAGVGASASGSALLRTVLARATSGSSAVAQPVMISASAMPHSASKKICDTSVEISYWC